MSNSIKVNFFYSSILTCANYFFPLLVYPYISRVLGVSNIGLINFIDSIINYLILFSTMGIAILGIREIAQVKNNIKKLSQTFCSLFTLTAIATMVMVVVLIILTLSVPQLKRDSAMMYIGAIKLISNFFLIEWFYKGLEDFRYITIRSIIVRCLYVISVFIFVKEENDTNIYFLITSLSIAINAFINIINVKKHIILNLKNINFRPYIRPLFIIGLYSVLTSMYTTFNVTFLGFTHGDKEVGYYATATKVYGILLAIYTAFTGVMIPKMSQLAKNNDLTHFNNLINKSCSILFSFSIPFIIVIELLVPQFIFIISGPGYEQADLTMRIIMPLMLIIGYEQIIVMQGLMPLKDDSDIFRNSFFGAIVGIVLNLILVNKLGAVGSAIVWLVSEILILILSQLSINKILGTKFPWKQIAKNCTIGIVMIPIVIFYKNLILNVYVLVTISLITVTILIIIYQLVLFPHSAVSLIVKSSITKLLSLCRINKF